MLAYPFGKPVIYVNYMEQYKTDLLDGYQLTEAGSQIVFKRLFDKDSCFAPHCDQAVLHIPGTCEFCDNYPDWQAYRILCSIAFTGQDAEQLTNEYIKEHNLPKECSGRWAFLPDPASYRRPVEQIEEWGGNIHENEYTKELREEAFKELERM